MKKQSSVKLNFSEVLSKIKSQDSRCSIQEVAKLIHACRFSTDQSIIVISIGGYTEEEESKDWCTCPKFAVEAASMGINVICINLDIIWDEIENQPSPMQKAFLDISLSRENLTVFKARHDITEYDVFLNRSLDLYCGESKNPDNKIIIANYMSPFVGADIIKSRSSLMPIPQLIKYIEENKIYVISGYYARNPCILLDQETSIAEISSGNYSKPSEKISRIAKAHLIFIKIKDDHKKRFAELKLLAEDIDLECFNDIRAIPYAAIFQKTPGTPLLTSFEANETIVSSTAGASTTVEKPKSQNKKPPL